MCIFSVLWALFRYLHRGWPSLGEAHLLVSSLSLASLWSHQ